MVSSVRSDLTTLITSSIRTTNASIASLTSVVGNLSTALDALTTATQAQRLQLLGFWTEGRLLNISGNDVSVPVSPFGADHSGSTAPQINCVFIPSSFKITKIAMYVQEGEFSTGTFFWYLYTDSDASDDATWNGFITPGEGDDHGAFTHNSTGYYRGSWKTYDVDIDLSAGSSLTAVMSYNTISGGPEAPSMFVYGYYQ